MTYEENCWRFWKVIKQALSTLKQLWKSCMLRIILTLVLRNWIITQSASGLSRGCLLQGKTVEQVAAIMEKLAQVHNNILGTRADDDKFAAVQKVLPMRFIIKIRA